MRVVITGGTGLIGGALSRDLAADGHTVVVLSRRPDAGLRAPPGVELAVWDPREPAGWRSVLEGADAVVNLAGANIAGGRWSARRKRLLEASRVVAGQAVTAAIAEAERPPPVLLQASAVGYYGPRGDEELAEDAPPGTDFLGRLAQRWEASTAAVSRRGTRRILLRTGVVLARDGGALPRLALPFRFFAGGPVGRGQQWVPWIHLADQVGAMRLLIEQAGAAGPYNLTAPEPVRNRELARELGRVLRRPARLPVPPAVLWLALGEMACVITGGQRAVPARLQASGYRFRFPRLGPALSDLFCRA